MQKLLFIGLAGLLGTLLRYAVSVWAGQKYGETFPWGTLLVNLVGCFLAGLFFHLLFERFVVREAIRTTVLIGFLGGFTTFSSFGLQTFGLLREGQSGAALFNICASNLGGLLMVWLGYALAKVL